MKTRFKLITNIDWIKRSYMIFDTKNNLYHHIVLNNLSEKIIFGTSAYYDWYRTHNEQTHFFSWDLVNEVDREQLRKIIIKRNLPRELLENDLKSSLHELQNLLETITKKE